jgi:hypothetical protein
MLRKKINSKEGYDDSAKFCLQKQRKFCHSPRRQTKNLKKGKLTV